MTKTRVDENSLKSNNTVSVIIIYNQITVFFHIWWMKNVGHLSNNLITHLGSETFNSVEITRGS